MARKRIGDILIDAGIITEEQLQIALEDQRDHQTRLGDVLIARNYISEQQLIEVLEIQLGIPHVQLYRQTIDNKMIQLIPMRLAEQHQVLPLRAIDNKLVVAMADPLDYFAIDELRMSTGYRIEPVIASKDELKRAIKRFYSLQEPVNQLMQNLQTSENTSKKVQDDEYSPVVRTVNQVIIQAVGLGASDIHIDPQEDQLRIRYRVDGMMRTERTLPLHMQSVIIARIKIMADMDVAEHRLPQDGRFEMDIEYRKVDIRVSSLPTIFGEKIVMRILDLGNEIESIENIGFSESNLGYFVEGISNPHGLVLITGPTGSGKTTTLYSSLRWLNNDEVNIVTVEDPVEFHMQGINQMQVNLAKGLTFAKGLRAILRQDPNIVMVGEIRDKETAEIAVSAAMTGHLVLSTLHTNSAANSVTRLIDMGVEPFLISSAISCVVAQRLVRKICPACSFEYTPAGEERRWLQERGYDSETLRKGAGCMLCGQSGYRGRLAIHEVLTADNALRSMILQKKSDNEYTEYALQRGMIPMFIDGIEKVKAGLTTVSEVLRVTREL